MLRRIDPCQWQLDHRQPRRCDPAFTDVDEHDPRGEAEALGTQCIRAARVTAPHRANVDTAANASDDQAPDEPTEEIREQCFEREFEHRQV